MLIQDTEVFVLTKEISTVLPLSKCYYLRSFLHVIG
jgi:hypothetical protein